VDHQPAQIHLRDLKNPSLCVFPGFVYSFKINMVELAKEVIVLIVVIASGVCVVLAWAVHSMWHGRQGDDDEVKVHDSEQQLAAYRKEVRFRNQESMAAINAYKYPSHRYDGVWDYKDLVDVVGR
jgi:hypothetical protein